MGGAFLGGAGWRYLMFGGGMAIGTGTTASTHYGNMKSWGVELFGLTVVKYCILGFVNVLFFATTACW